MTGVDHHLLSAVQVPLVAEGVPKRRLQAARSQTSSQNFLRLPR